jgi:urease accessory protein
MPRSRSSRVLVVVAALAGAGAPALLGATPALAHTGLPAGGAVDGMAHPVLGPDHLLAMVAVGMLAALAPDRRTAWLTPIGFVAGMAGGAVLGLAGITVPLVEVAIGVSVVVLGLLLVGRAASTWRWLPAVAAAMGAAHGHAHGAELPAGAVPVAYVAGFLAVTALLHVLGAGVGIGVRSRTAGRVAAGAFVSAAGVVLLLGA